MRILKKSLACLLVAIMAATAMFGCLVSADTITGQMSIGSIADITDGSTDPIEFSVTVSNGTNADGVDIAAIAAIVKVSANFDATYELEIAENTEDYIYTDGVIKCTEDTEVNNAEGKILIEAEANDGTGAWTYATVNVTVTPTAALTAGNAYSITVGTADEINGATYDETGIIYTPATAELTVNYPMGHELNPYVFDGRWGQPRPIFVTIPAGATVYARADYLSGYDFAVTDAEGAVVEGYTATISTVSTDSESFSVTNTTDADLYGYLGFSKLGTMNTPEIITETADLVAPELFEAYHYQYTATEDGSVTITMKDETDWQLNVNIAKADYSVVAGDAVYSEAVDGAYTQTLELTAGDVVTIIVALNLDDQKDDDEVINWNFTIDEATAECDHANVKVNMDKDTHIWYEECTACGEKTETTPVVYEGTLISHSLLFGDVVGDTIGINRGTSTGLVNKGGYSDYYIEVEYKEYGSGYVVVEEIDSFASNEYAYQNAAGTVDYFNFSSVALTMMAEEFTVNLYLLDAEGDVTAVNSSTTSIQARALAYAQKYSTDTVLLTSLADMVNYGAALQEYFAAQNPGTPIATAKLPTEGFEAYLEYASTEDSLPDSFNNTKLGTKLVDTSTIVFGNTALKIGASNLIYTQIKANSYDANNMTLTVSYTDSYGSPVVDTVSFADLAVTTSGSNTLYTYEFKKLRLAELEKTVTFIVTYNGVDEYKYEYSIGNYANTYINNEQMKPVITAMELFAISARAQLIDKNA